MIAIFKNILPIFGVIASGCLFVGCEADAELADATKAVPTNMVELANLDAGFANEAGTTGQEPNSAAAATNATASTTTPASTSTNSTDVTSSSVAATNDLVALPTPAGTNV